MFKARLYVAGVAYDMLAAALEGITLDADIVSERADRLLSMALGGV
jgi:hypothetical protein